MSWGSSSSSWTPLPTSLHDVPAHYAGLREVPVSVSSKYSAAPPTGIPRDFRPVGEDILDANDYDFVFERKLIDAIEKEREAECQAKEKRQAARTARKRAAEEGKNLERTDTGALANAEAGLARSVQTAEIPLSEVDFSTLAGSGGRRSMSGDVDDSRPVAKANSWASTEARPAAATPTLDPRRLDRSGPSPVTRAEPKQLEGSPSSASSTIKRPADFNFLEFEQGLAPPDPWDVPQDDLSAIGEVLGVHPPKPPVVPRSQPHREPQLVSFPSQRVPSATIPHQSMSGSAGLGIGFSYTGAPPNGPEPHGRPSNGPFTYPGSGSERPFSYGLAPPSGAKNAIAPSPPVPPRPAGMVSEPSSTRSPDLSAPEPPSDLSYVQKKLFTSVTSMGFPANAVERAVKHHGTDEKKVVDFAVAFTPLMSTGLFAPEDIDIALLLFESDYERADKFLRGSARLREMGFDKVDVQEAMLHKNNDEMAAAEWLLAGKKG